MKITRKKRLTKRQTDAIATKLVNRRRKEKERARRDQRMMDHIRRGSLPYTPNVMSWLSATLGIKSACITDAQLARLHP